MDARLPRDDISDLKAVKVYAKHFRDDDIEVVHKVPNGDGTFTKVPRAKLKLKDGAIPCFLPSCPSYYSSKSTSKRTRLSFETKEEEMMNQTLQMSLITESEEKEKYKKLYSSFGLENDFCTYLSRATPSFTPQEKNVIVQMDEIHVKSDVL